MHASMAAKFSMYGFRLCTVGLDYLYIMWYIDNRLPPISVSCIKNKSNCIRSLYQAVLISLLYLKGIYSSYQLQIPLTLFYTLACINQIKSFIIPLYYAEACSEFAGPVSASLRPGNPDRFEEMLQRWQAVGKTGSDLTGSRFEFALPLN